MTAPAAIGSVPGDAGASGARGGARGMRPDGRQDRPGKPGAEVLWLAGGERPVRGVCHVLAFLSSWGLA